MGRLVIDLWLQCLGRELNWRLAGRGKVPRGQMLVMKAEMKTVLSHAGEMSACRLERRDIPIPLII
ncbi:hypothetical protein X742_32020 [Mesorhizobium sp. LNHC232B00]|nr:hypothetical protein X742_32020 [Mesorhizobium sp. LNHC232B00]